MRQESTFYEFFTIGGLMKRFLLLAVLIVVAPFLLGMGSLQGPASPEKIPVPVKKYTATVLDQMDVVAQCSDVSIEGETFLEGKRGEGNYTISFDNIAQVLFRLQEGKLIGIVMLRGGESSELTLTKNQKLYGRTRYGTFQITLSDLKKLVIEAASSQK